MLSVIVRHYKLILIWGMIVMVLVVGLSLFLPLKYSAESGVLIISRGQIGVDPYTQAKSAERVGETLAEVISTSDFFSKVMDNKTNIFDRDFWNKLDERALRVEWSDDIKSTVVYGTSLLRITVYATTPKEVLALSQAVTDTLQSRGSEYVGGDVAIKTVNDPLVSRWPTQPNLPLNAGLGFAVGVILSALWVVRNKRHLPFGHHGF